MSENITVDDRKATRIDPSHAVYRRPAFNVNPPALSRHVVFRLGHKASPIEKTSDGEYQEAVNDLIDEVNAHLKTIQRGNPHSERKFFARHYKKERDRPASQPPANGFNLIDRSDTLLATARDARGFRLRVRADIHVEYVTLTYLADSFVSAPDNPAYIAATIACFDVFGGGKMQSELGAMAAQSIADLLFDGFWKSLAGVYEAPNLPSANQFADFRSVAICPAETAEEMRENARLQHPLPDKSVTAARHRKKIDERLLAFTQQNWNFVEATLGIPHDGPPETKNRAANVVLCGMLNGAAMYGSDLGQPKQADEGPTSSSPAVHYFIFFNGQSQSQLGRLMRRCNTLGELRMAALFDIIELRGASRSLRYLGTKLTNAREDTDKPKEKSTKVAEPEVTNAGKSHGTRAGPKKDDIAEPLNTQTINEASAELANAGGTIQGGLTYRVNQSRYYAQTYRERLADLRIVRVEGWQPYDEFVRRNLFMEFDYISQIGERHKTLERRIERETSLAQLGAFKRYYNTIESNTDALSDIQSKASLIADYVGGAACTYYGGHVIATVLVSGAGLLAYMNLCGKAICEMNATDPPAPLQFVCFCTALASFFVARYIIEKRHGEKKQKSALKRSNSNGQALE